MQKKTILHIIDDFGLGGAEAMLVGVLKNLTDFHNIVVNLYDNNKFGEDLQCDKYYCLHLKSPRQFLTAVPKLSKIIRENKVDLVHSNLCWSTIIARLATPRRIPLVNTIHSSVSTGIEYNNLLLRLLEKFTYYFRSNIIIGVSASTLEDYFCFFKLKRGKHFLLYNFVDEEIFKPVEREVSQLSNCKRTFKVLSVGSLKAQKNHSCTLDAFDVLKGEQIELDIIGEGVLREELTTTIAAKRLNVNLAGNKRNMQELYPDYDLFLLSSHYEGFSIAVLEAMATKTPLLLSDIPNFREQCADTAEYFPANDHRQLAAKLRLLKENRSRLERNAEKAHERLKSLYTFDRHLSQLRSIYREALNEKKRA